MALEQIHFLIGQRDSTEYGVSNEYVLDLFSFPRGDVERAIFGLGGTVSNEYLEVAQASPSNKTRYMIDGTRNKARLYFTNNRNIGDIQIRVKKDGSNIITWDVSDRNAHSDTFDVNLIEGDRIYCYIKDNGGTKPKEVWLKVKLWQE